MTSNRKRATGKSPARPARYWVPALAYMALIWVLSSIPRTLPVELVRFQDKWIHLVEYAVLSVLYGFALLRTRPAWRRTSVFAFAALLAALWGVTDEIHQNFVPNRSADVLDAAADALGAVAGAGIYAWMVARRERNR
jgi:VanZ family protein